MPAAALDSSSRPEPRAPSQSTPPAAPQDERLDDGLVVGRVWELSQDAHGCRMVQRAIDLAGDDGEIEAIAGELRGHVLAAVRSPHANHVLQKVIASIRPASAQFVLDELAAEPAQSVAMHKYGCRIIQRLFEHCSPHQVAFLEEEILAETCDMSRHQYGNYVIQVILQHGSPRNRARIVATLKQNLRTVCSVPYGCAVIGTILATGAPQDGEQFAGLLAREVGLLSCMATSRFGGAAVVRVLELSRGAARRAAIDRLMEDIVSLRACKHGKEVAEYMDAEAARLPESYIRAGA